jgi:hypothetical protein
LPAGVALPSIIEAPHRRSRASLHCSKYNLPEGISSPCSSKSTKQFCVSGRK